MKQHKPLNKTKRSGSVDETTTTTTTPTRSQSQAPSGPQLGVAAMPGVQPKIDYSLLEKVGPKEEEEVFRNIYQRLAKTGDDPWPEIRKLDSDGQRWLKHALVLYVNNAKAMPPGFDHKGAVRRLFERAKSKTTMPGAKDQAFEREVLQVCGWKAQMLVGQLKTPVPLDHIYRPSKKTETTAENVDSTQADMPVKTKAARKSPSPQRKEAIKAKLRPALYEFFDHELKQWPKPRTQESLEQFKPTARFVQAFIEKRPSPWREYVTASPDSPYLTGYAYDKNIHSTGELTADSKAVFQRLLTRAIHIGGDKAYREPLVEAGVDLSKQDDLDAFTEVLGELMAEEDGRIYDATIASILLTARHSGAGNAYLVTTVAAGTKPADWKWKQAHTLIHEFLHHLAHPDYVKKVRDIDNKSVLKEGIVEMLTAEVFGELAEYVKTDDNVRSLVLGDTPYAPPPADLLKTGYLDAGKTAEEIRAAVGRDNVYAAFFLGVTQLIGCK